MQFLGTAAADVIPNPFCRCPICEDARQNPEHRRLRSCFLLDEETLLDFGPDLAAVTSLHTIPLDQVRRIFITHTHEDHFCPSNFGLIEMSRTFEHPIELYLSEAGHDALQDTFNDIRGQLRTGLTVYPLKVGEPVEVGHGTVVPIPTNHRVSTSEIAVNYLFIHEQQRFLYATDTGLYGPEALALLETYGPIDILVMEATFGSAPLSRESGHLNGEHFVEQLQTLLDRGSLRPASRVFAMHINHKHAWNHPAYQAWFDEHAPLKVIVAQDGLCIEPHLL